MKGVPRRNVGGRDVYIYSITKPHDRHYAGAGAGAAAASIRIHLDTHHIPLHTDTMSYTDKERRDNSKKQLRDGDGHFIPVKSPFKPKVKNTSSVSDPLFSFTINNPFKKILQWLDYLRKHHTTSFDFKIKVPLIALPFFLFAIFALFQGFFSLGQYTKKQQIEALPSPTPIIITEPTTTQAPVRSSYIGVIQSTYFIPTVVLSPPVEPSSSVQPDNDIFITNRYILLDKEDKVIFLEVSSGVSMDSYLGKRVLITGLYDPQSHSLRIAAASDIEILR